MNISEHGLGWYVNKLKENVPFTIGKFGDGELACLFKFIGYKGVDHFGDSNRDGHEYFKDLGEAFHNSFINERGYIKVCARHWFKHKDVGKLFDKYVQEFHIDVNKTNIHHAGWLYNSAERGELGILKEQLEKMNFVLVADSRKTELKIKRVAFIEVPARVEFVILFNHCGEVVSAESVGHSVISTE